MMFARLALGFGLFGFSFACVAVDLDVTQAHEPQFQQVVAQVAANPLEVSPDTISKQYPDATLLAVSQYLQQLRASASVLTSSQRQWLSLWANSEDVFIREAASELLLCTSSLPAANFQQWLLLPTAQQLSSLDNKAFELCSSPYTADSQSSKVGVALALHCRDSKLFAQLINQSEPEAIIASLAQVLQHFNSDSAKQLLMLAAEKGDLAIVAMPILAQQFGADMDVQQLMVKGLHDDRIGPVAAVNLAKYGTQQTLDDLNRKLQLQQLESPADRFALFAIEQSDLVDPLVLN